MPGRIIITLDGSPLAERALPVAVALARASSSRLLLLRVVDGVTQHRLAAEQYLRSLLERANSDGIAAEPAIVSGSPADAICDEADATRYVGDQARRLHADGFHVETETAFGAAARP